TGDMPSSYQTESLAVDWRFLTPVLYVGTSRGVFRSTDLGGQWSRFGAGMPRTEVDGLELLPQLDVLAAATFGRGTYEIGVPVPTLAMTGPATAALNDVVTYSVSVTNDSARDAQGVVFTDPLPDGMQFVSANFTQGNWAFAGGTLSGNLGMVPGGA